MHLQNGLKGLVEGRRRRRASTKCMVTCARTRGSRMKVLWVAMDTASAICPMSASLKFRVMRGFVATALRGATFPGAAGALGQRQAGAGQGRAGDQQHRQQERAPGCAGTCKNQKMSSRVFLGA